MKTIKKSALFCLSLLAALTAFAGCAFGSKSEGSESPESSNGSSVSESSSAEENSSSQEENSSSEENESSDSGNSSSSDSDSSSSVEDNDSSSSEKPEEDEEIDEEAEHDLSLCVWGDWELHTQATCNENGVMAKYCTYQKGNKHAQYQSFAARGHDYGNDAKCIRCDLPATLPPADGAQSYTNPNDANANILGDGSDYGRYELAFGGYYELEIGSTGSVWFSFPVPEAGQYAVITTEAPANVKLNRYDASAHFITPTPYPARTLSDGNLAGSVSCDENHWSSEWRATFCFEGFAGDTVKFYTAKIDGPAWTPGYVRVDMEASQHNGKVAPDGAEGTVATPVPYDSEYFFDTELGYYRMGTESNPKDIIFVAISANAPRLFGEISFTKIQTEGPNLLIGAGQLASGDYLSYNYAPFIMTDPVYGGKDTAYEAFVNKDGMYPVTKELYEFLCRYVAKNSTEDSSATNPWLAPCYYYKALTPGSEEYPIKLTQTGSFTAQPYNAKSTLYYTFRNTEATLGAYYTITVHTENVRLFVGSMKNGVYYDDANFSFELNATTGFTFGLLDKTGAGRDIEVTISVMNGSIDAPIAVENLGEATLTPNEILALDKSNIYETTYAYTATENGVLCVQATSDAQIIVGNNVLKNGASAVAVKKGETATIHVSGKNANAINATLSFASATEIGLNETTVTPTAYGETYVSHLVYTATADGIVSLTTASQANVLLNGSTVDGVNAVAVNAGDVVHVYINNLYDENNAELASAPVNFTLAFTVASSLESLGENTLTPTAFGDVYVAHYVYVATEDCTITVSAGTENLFVNGEKLVLSQDGETASLTITVKAGDTVSLWFTAGSADATAVTVTAE